MLVTIMLTVVILNLAVRSFFMPILFVLDVKVTVMCGLKDGCFVKRVSCVAGTLTTILRLKMALSCSVFLVRDCRRRRVHCSKSGRHTVTRTVSRAFSSMVKDSIAAVTKFVTLYFVSFALKLSVNIIVIGNIVLNMLTYMAVLPSVVLYYSGVVRGAGRGPFLPSVKGVSSGIAGECLVCITLFMILLFPTVCKGGRANICCGLSRALPGSLPDVVTGRGLGRSCSVGAARVVLMSDSASSTSMNGVLGRVSGISKVG